jgi:hypothetical protein
MTTLIVVYRRVLQLPCPSGTFGNTTGLATPTCSGPCARGFQCPPGSLTAVTSACPQGYFCSGGPRQPCPMGRYGPEVATVSAASCQACPAGQYSNATAAVDASVCTTCRSDVGEGSAAGAASCWPALLSAVASNPAGAVVLGLSVGDEVLLSFSQVLTPAFVGHSSSAAAVGTPSAYYP